VSANRHNKLLLYNRPTHTVPHKMHHTQQLLANEYEQLDLM